MRQSNIILCPPPDDSEDDSFTNMPTSNRQHEVDRDSLEDETASSNKRESTSLEEVQDTNNNHRERSLLSEPLQQNFVVLKKRKVEEGDEETSETRRVAEETAAMIRDEVRRMQNAVAELEAYLQNAEEQPAHDAPVPEAIVVRGGEVHRFPELPRVVEPASSVEQASGSASGEASNQV